MASLEANESQVESTIRKPRLSYPYLGKCKFTEAIHEEQKFGDKTYKNLVLCFELFGDTDREGGRTPKGTEYPHIVWEFNDQTTLEQAQITVNHVWYILKHVFGNNYAKKITNFDYQEDESGDPLDLAADFQTWAAKVVKNIGIVINKIGEDKIPTLKTKVTGYVNDRDRSKPAKARLAWPTKFAGYLARVDEPIQFETGEIRNNAKYEQFMAASDSSSSSSASGSSNSSASDPGDEYDEDLDF